MIDHATQFLNQKREGVCVPVTDFEEPPLQALIIIRSSITMSFILSGQSARSGEPCLSNAVLVAAGLHDKDIFVSDRRVCAVSVWGGKEQSFERCCVQHY